MNRNLLLYRVTKAKRWQGTLKRWLVVGGTVLPVHNWLPKLSMEVQGGTSWGASDRLHNTCITKKARNDKVGSVARW